MWSFSFLCCRSMFCSIIYIWMAAAQPAEVRELCRRRRPRSSVHVKDGIKAVVSLSVLLCSLFNVPFLWIFNLGHHWLWWLEKVRNGGFSWLEQTRVTCCVCDLRFRDSVCQLAVPGGAPRPPAQPGRPVRGLWDVAVGHGCGAGGQPLPHVAGQEEICYR